MLLLAEILHHLACTRKILGYSQLVDFSHKQFKGNLDKPNLLGLSASWFGLLIRGFFVGFSENHPNLEPGPGDLIASKNRKEIRVLIRSWMPHGWFTSFWSPDWAVSYRTMGGSGSFLAACMTLKLLVWGKTPSMFYRVWNDLQPADPIWPWLKKSSLQQKVFWGGIMNVVPPWTLLLAKNLHCARWSYDPQNVQQNYCLYFPYFSSRCFLFKSREKIAKMSENNWY